MKKILLSLAALALLSGCNLAPRYQRPAMPTPAVWPVGAAYQAAPTSAATPVADIGWREFFADERLRQVIALALANNRDLRVSTLNIEQARAQYGIARAALLPSLSATATETAARTPADLSPSGHLTLGRQYSVNLGAAAYELDFFGRVRNLSASALQLYLGTEEARRTAHISLVAEVATTYLTLAADQQRLYLAQDTLNSQQASYEISARRYQAGSGAALEMYNARTTVESARSDLALYTSQVALDQNALVLLVGGPVAESLLPSAALDSVTVLSAIGPDLASDLLQRRPDVRQAEHTLAAANANIGVARAAFFPSITLTAAAGTASSSLAGLFQGGSSDWSFVPRLNLPIFDGGRNQANLELAKVGRAIALTQYEKSIQVAFREVADALAQRGTLDARLSAQQALLQAATQSYQIYAARYRQGADSYLNALIAQRTQYRAQQSLISVQLATLTNAVTLYKVLGGGWRQEAPLVVAGGQ